MFWKSDRTDYGSVISESVQMYECQFTALAANSRTHDIRCLVVANTVEEAIAACRGRWPDGFVLHAVNKRNRRCDLIVCESVIPLAERGDG